MIKFKDILSKKSDAIDILKPRRSREERDKNYIIAIHKQIKNYIKNGSEGDLNLYGATIQLLPDNLTKVGGNLDLRKSSIEKLPDNLKNIGEDLYLDYVGSIKYLPDNLTVGNDLFINGTELKSLPDNLTVHGSINLSTSEVSELPKNLTVGRNLYLSGTPLVKKYTDQELRDLLPGVKGDIWTNR